MWLVDIFDQSLQYGQRLRARSGKRLAALSTADMPGVAAVPQHWQQQWRLPLSSEDAAQLAVAIKQATDLELTRDLGFSLPAQPAIHIHLEAADIHARMAAAQAVISSLHYNHTAGNYFSIRKARPYCLLMQTAREMLRNALPIKCVEAVFLGLLLTSGWNDVDRVPLGFRSCVGGRVYRHIVLAVRHRSSGCWGALGLSRRAELMDKVLTHNSLASLVDDYQQAYQRWWHELLKLRVGLPAPHDPASPCMQTPGAWSTLRPSYIQVRWRECCIIVHGQKGCSTAAQLEQHVQHAAFQANSSLPELVLTSAASPKVSLAGHAL